MPEPSNSGLVTRSVQARRFFSRPSAARISAPEHCEAMSWRWGSRRMRASIAGSSAMVSVWVPLPTTTASALAAKSSGRWASTTTPFLEATRPVGAVIQAFQPWGRSRFRRFETTKESISLKPSKVRTAICMAL